MHRQPQSYAKCALRMQQFADSRQVAKSPISGRFAGKIAGNSDKICSLMFRRRHFPGTWRPSEVRSDSSHWPNQPASVAQSSSRAALAVEIRPPFDKGALAVDDLEDTQGGLESRHRQRGLAAELIGLRALDVGQRKQPLADMAALVMHAPDRADRVARFALLDGAFAGAADPDRVIVEITDDFPDLRGRLRGKRCCNRLLPWRTPNGSICPSMGPAGPMRPPDLRQGRRSWKQLKFAPKPPLKGPNS